jgi:hypothetical protein
MHRQEAVRRTGAVLLALAQATRLRETLARRRPGP